MRIRPAGSFFTLQESMERVVEIKSLQIVPFTHTIHLSLFNDPHWDFKPHKSAKLHYTLDGTRHTLTVFPKILMRTVNEPPRRSTDTQTWTTFVLYARDYK